jgi:hypothetical protein
MVVAFLHKPVYKTLIMKMKTLVVALLFLFALSTSTVHASAITAGEPTKEKHPELTEAQKARIEEMKKRVYEIKAMDFSKLTKVERKDLRKELKDLNKEAKATRGYGIYLSLGAIIIIILLLILLL